MTTMNQTRAPVPAMLRTIAGLSLTAILLPGCDESGPRIYTAQPYLAALGCLSAYTPISLVETHDVSALCEPVCLRIGAALYVSTLCAPYPGESTQPPASDPECAAALAAPSCGELAADAAAP